MTKVSDLIKSSKNFQVSVNIDFDLGNEEKIRNFIPTQESLKLLEEIILSVNDNSKRARILIGAYGKGKSYIILVLLSILSSAVENKSCYDLLLKKINEYKPELSQYVKEYINSNKKLLPIVINGSSASLSQSFMHALYTTLKRKEFENLMPQTHFEAAVNMIDLWKEKFPETYKAFNKEASVKADTFKEALKNFDGEKFEEFENLYPHLTSGAEFNPFSGFDVVDLYSKVSEKLSEFGYSGIFVVYDEFGKYLESSITKATIKDVKLLQDFAEKADRSEKNQLHLLLICHKEIENYIDSLPKQKVDGWKGVSERFTHVHLYNNYSESYELIGNAIVKNEKMADTFFAEEKVSNQFKKLISDWKENRLFSAEKNLVEKLTKECWPLHPVTTYILPRLSEKVAQNERTLFTFISGNGTLTLNSATKNKMAVSDEKLFLISPDVLYDYFSQGFQNEPYTSEIKKQHMISSSVLQKCEDLELESKIIKTLTLVYVLNQFERLQPSTDEIFSIYQDCGYSFDEVKAALSNLTKNLGLLYERASSNRFLQLKEPSGIDLPKLISDTIEKRKNFITDTQILNDVNTEKYLYPVKYNTDYSVTRFFKVKFVNASDDFVESQNSDGTFFALLDSEINRKEIEEKSVGLKNAVFAIPKKSENIHALLRKYDAVCFLQNQNVQDKTLFSEFEIIKDDLFDGIKLFIHSFIQPERNDCVFIAGGKEIKLYKKSDLSNELSKQMEDVFEKTPAINNEMINKNFLTGQAHNSRIKLMDAILKSDAADLDLKGSGQEVSFMRSCLTVPGILNTKSEAKRFILEPSTDNKTRDKNFKAMFLEIEKFVKKSNKKEVNFLELIENLTGKEKGFGLRLGVIPIYLSVVFQKYAKNIVIKAGDGEVPLSSEVLCDIAESPKEYSLLILEWNDEKEKYEKRLEKIFEDYVVESEKQKVGYEYLLNGILRWYRALPKFAKQTQSFVNEEDLRFIKIFKTYPSGVQNFLFVKLPNVFGKKEADAEVADKIENVKKHFDCVKFNAENALILQTKERFLPSKNADKTLLKSMSLKSCFEKFTEQLSKEVFNHIFENDANKLFSVFSDKSNDEYEVIENLAVLLTGLKVDDWTDDTKDSYFSWLDEFIKTLKEYVAQAQTAAFEKDTREENLSEGKNLQKGYSISFENENGNPVTKSFEKVPTSRRAQILQNEIKRSIEEMGQSISQAEKRQVLIELLEALCK